MAGRPSPDPDASSTRERILDTAEALFAEQGFDGTSLRQITREAGVNLAAIHYHFGSKDALIDAVFARLVGPINAARLAMLDEVEREAGEGAPELERVLEAFILPPLQSTADVGTRTYLDGRRIKLIGRIYSAERQHISKQLFFNQFREVLERFRGAFGRCLPGLSEAALTWRIHFTVGAMVHIVHTAGDPVLCSMLGMDSTRLEARAIARRMIPFLAAGLRAPEEDAP